MSFGTSLVDSGCPYCGEPVQLVVDEGEEEQDYIEDCQVCCRPMQVSVRRAHDGSIELQLRDENE